MPRPHTALVAPMIGLAAVLGTGCEEALSPPAETTGAVHVSVATGNPEFGPRNGYRISLNGASHRGVEINGATLFSGLASGAYSLRLEGVPTSCTVHGNNPRTVTLSAGTTEKVDFQVSCSAPGSVRVTVETTGVDPDPDGYSVTVVRTDTRARWSALVPPNQAVSIHGLDAGDYIVTLYGVALNCEARDSISRRITVTARSTIPVVFAVECAPLTQLAYVAYGSSDSTDIYIAKSNGLGAINLTNHRAADRDPAWSPDGRTIAFTSARDGADEVYVMNADGSGVSRLTTRGAREPTWSPDGLRIAFTRGHHGSADIYVINRDGTDQKQITSAPTAEFQPAWSPDGRTIAFVSNRDGNAEIYTMNSDGTSPVRVTNTPIDEAEPAWSPDGRKLAFTRHQCSGPSPSSCEYTVVVLKVGSPEEPRALAAGYQPAWSRDGRVVAYTMHLCGWYLEYYGECHPASIDFVREDGTGHVHLIHSAFQAAWRP